MVSLLTLLISLILPAATVEEAFDYFEIGDYASSARLLDQSATEDPEGFSQNNLHYLRGQIAIHQRDWSRADMEFGKIPPESVLHSLSIWHRAQAALKRGQGQEALDRLAELEPGFPDALLLQLADGAEESTALQIYGLSSSRQAEWERASILDDEDAMWSLLRRNHSDEFALRAAERLDGHPSDPALRLDLARTFYAHRAFGRAEVLYVSLLGEGSALAAEAFYGLGRTYFQMGRYDDAIAIYRMTVEGFPRTDWQRQADEQIPVSYWRKLDYPEALAAYLALIEKYSDDRDVYHSAVRDIVDLYRSMGQTDEAERWIDEGLRRDPRPSERTVLLFSLAKIQYNNGRYQEALASFQQIRGTRTRQVANGTDSEEVRFLEAATLEKLARLDEAVVIWRELAHDGFSYYGLRSISKLRDIAVDPPPNDAVYEAFRRAMEMPVAQLCHRDSYPSSRRIIRERRLSRTRGFRTSESPETDLVGELVFLRQWQEAFYWANRVASRWRDQALADLAYLASDFRRSMLYADRLRPIENAQLFSSDSTYSEESRALMEMLYPTAFADVVCREAEAAGVDPLWLYAIMWQESRYDPRARSGAAARGLMQFIPETATRLAASLGMTFQLDDLYQPEVSIRLGAHYWAELLEQLGSPELALAAYNGGVNNVERWREKAVGAEDGWFVPDIGFAQTKTYVREVFALYAKYAHLL